MANEQTIANLIVKLTADTVGMMQGFSKAEDAVQSFTSGVQKILGGVSFLYISKQFENMVMGIVNAAADLSKIGQKVGMSATEIGKLSAAAEHVGISTDTMARSLRFLSKSMTTAQDGNLALQMTFKELGIQIETLPGIAAKPYDVFLQLADAFAATNDEARKTAIAMQVLGRGGAEMVPFLDEGSATIQEWVTHAEKMGSVMGSGLASQSRSFKFTLTEIKDAVDGLKIAFAEALLPYLQELADDMLSVAERINSFKSAMSSVVPILRDVGIAIAFLATAKFLTWIAAATGGVGLFASAFAALSNPVFAVAAALAAFVIATEHVRDSTEAANRELATFDRSIKRMSLGDLDAEAGKLRNTIEDLTEDLVKLRVEQDAAIAATTGEDTAAVVAMNNLINTKQAQLKLAQDKLNKVMFKQEDQQMKLGIGVTTDPEAFKSLKDKIGQLKAEMISFQDPLKGQVAAFEAWITQLKLGKVWTEALAAAEKEARAQLMANLAAQNALAVTQARRSGNLKQEVAYYDAYLSELQSAYDLGITDLESYFSQREMITKDRGAAEIAALQASLKDPGLTPGKKIEIEAEITVRKTNLGKDLAQGATEYAKAVNAAAASTREGSFQALVDKNGVDLETMKQQYENGIVDIQNFFEKQRQIVQEEAKKQIANVEAAQALTPKGTKEWQDLENEKNRITAKAGLDRIKLAGDESKAYAANFGKMTDTALNFQKIKAELAVGDLDRLKAQNALALLEQERRDQQELADLRATKGDTIMIEGEAVDKTEAERDMMGAQQMRRNKMVADQDTAVRLQQLSMTQQVTTGMSDMFGALYEATGKKVKAFFYLQKAASIATAVVNVAEGVTKALAQGGIFGMAMAAMITATGAAQIATIMGQTFKGMFRGGPVTSGSGTKDDVPAMLTRGEYVIPKRSVEHYGTNVMEAIRRMIIPKDALGGFGFFPVARPQFAFAGGGAVTGGAAGTTNIVNVGGVNVNEGNNRLASRLREELEITVLRVLKEQTR